MWIAGPKIPRLGAALVCNTHIKAVYITDGAILGKFPMKQTLTHLTPNSYMDNL